MEASDKVVNNGPGGSRWNPTKEQINMLEGLYKQGLRTPSAEQIQQISVRLRDFGHIEGKNVFYWFQNHKARQRQKQKQDNFDCYNRFVQGTPVFQPYQTAVVCGPCWNMPQPKNIDPGLYQQYPKVALPKAPGVDFKRCRLLIPDQAINDEPMCRQSSHHHQETLDLFPIHPTGLLKARNGIVESESTKNDNFENKNTSTSSENDNGCSIFGGEEAGKVHHFFDFFCKN